MLALGVHAGSAAATAVVVDVDGMVHPITAEIVRSAIAQAGRENASVLIFA